MYNQANKPKAVWTHVQDVLDADQKRSIYFSDGGAVKITRHTPKGEQLVTMFPGNCLEDLIKVAPAFEQVLTAFNSIADDIAKVKEMRKEATALERQKQKELDRAVLEVQAAQDKQRLALARIEALTGKKIA